MIELLGDILKNRPSQDLGLKSVIIVDGIPQIAPDRFEKLRTVLLKLFSKFGTIFKDHFPLDENNCTKGFVFKSIVTFIINFFKIQLCVFRVRK